MDALQEFEQALEDQTAVLFVGPSGRGKTFIAQTHKLPSGGLVDIEMTPQTQEDPLFGTMAFDVVTQAYKHLDGPLTEGVCGPKRIVVDEITTAPADVSHLWHKVANREAIRVKTDNYRRVEIHPGHQLVGTSNLEGYGGNYRLSPAFYSRFHMIEWFGFTVDEEAEFFANKYTNLDPLNIADFVTVGHKVAQNVGAHQTEFVVGMREVDRACKFLRAILKCEPNDQHPHVTAFVKTIRRPCRLLAPDLLNHLDATAEKCFKADYARAIAREEELRTKRETSLSNAA